MLFLTNIKKINSLLIGTNTHFNKYLEKSKRLFVRKTYTTSCKLAAAGETIRLGINTYFKIEYIYSKIYSNIIRHL